MSSKPDSVLRQVTVAVALAVVTLLLTLYFFNHFTPKSPLPSGVDWEGFDSAGMRAAVTPARVAAYQQKILSFGSRFIGQPGFYKTVDYVRQAYKDAGLEVIEYDNQTVAPCTLERTIADPAGKPLAGVEIYPYFPNYIQPMNSPAEGLTGTLVKVTDALLNEGKTFDDCIALIDAMEQPKTFGSQWAKYAQIGFKAVIISSEDGLDKVNWRKALVVGSLPINYVRLVATPEIFKHTGEQITLHVRQEYRKVSNPIVVGILKAGTPSAEGRRALVIPNEYDAPSILPDLAPGELSAVPIATHLAMLDGLKGYQSQLRRDVVFVASGGETSGQDSAARMMSILGGAQEPAGTRIRLGRELAEHQGRLKDLAAVLPVVQDAQFLRDARATDALVDGLDSGPRGFFHEQFRYVMNTELLRRSEQQLQKRIEFLKTRRNDTKTPEFSAYMKAKVSYDVALSVGGYPLKKLVESASDFVKQADLVGACRARFAVLQKFHEAELQRATQALAIHDALHKYAQIVVVSPQFLPTEKDTKGKPGVERVTVFMGQNVEDNSYVQYPLFNNAMMRQVEKIHREDAALSPVAGEPGTETAATTATRPAETPRASVQYDSIANTKQSNSVGSLVPDLLASTTYWNRLAYAAVSLVNPDRKQSYELRATPTSKPFMRDLATMDRSLGVGGDLVLWLAHGNGWFAPPVKAGAKSFAGRAFVAGVGQSVVPDYPLVGAVFAPMPRWQLFPQFGYIPQMMDITDPYGRFARYEWPADLVWPFTPELASYGPDGVIQYIKDDGSQGQSVYSSRSFSQFGNSPVNVNVVMFRATPVSLLDLINPQTMTSYQSVEFVQRDGLAGVNRFYNYKTDEGIVNFMEPDLFLFVELKSGAADSPSTQVTRAFLLGTEDKSIAVDSEKEIDGPGYLAASTPLILDVPRRAADAMLQVNARRLALQQKFNMADERAVTFAKRAEDRLAESTKAPSQHERTLLSQDSVTYSTLNHPVLRGAVSEAVWGVLWYLGLLVPFAFFFEKLVFGFADVRKQLITQAMVILVVFALLKLMHPAFEMIRSSLMILLGFVILLISVGITLMFSGKFQENLEELQKQRGKVTAAEINTLGVVGTAFMLGLNNMHRRKVRTGLTCATLVLITFAMICFTSVTSDLRERAVAIGKAPYQGFLITTEEFWPIHPNELFALQAKYGNFNVAPRTMYVGDRTWDQVVYNPQIAVLYQPPAQDATQPAKTPAARKEMAKSILVLSHKEPLRDRIKILTKRGWFGPPPRKMGADDPIHVILPEKMAQDLSLRPLDIDAVVADKDLPIVDVAGKKCKVWGIFVGETLADARDLDGRNLLPFDAEAVANPKVIGDHMLLGSPGNPAMSADRVILAAAEPFAETRNIHASPRLTSVAVEFNALGYKDAKSTIDARLEQSQNETYYGLDGVSYFGQLARAAKYEGLLALLVPLLVAALTVLNTMRGSVYERRDEIFVYNAVGIAPKYVFFMFFAEAFVYAVVGAVLGFLLSQGLGLTLTKLNMTGGMNMTFTSINTIYASLAVGIAVFISTYFPARSAGRIATPSDDQGWALPPAVDDCIAFALPFTFDRKDRVAVLEFFNRIFLDHGEGGAGRFHAGKPEFFVEETPTEMVPQIRTTIWLKPFDLGVSQELIIRMPADPETGEYIARLQLTRLSGTRESWMRLNEGFVSLVRKHFLYWRAVSPDERQRLFAEARKQIEAGTVAPASASADSTEVA